MRLREIVRQVTGVTTLGFACLPLLVACGGGEPSAGLAPAAQADEERLGGLAAPGRIEGASQTVEVGAAMDGVLEAVLVHEGQTVELAAPLARLVCADVEAGLAAAQQEAEAARQARARVVRGSRDEEREAARAETAAADAVLAQVRLRHERQERLRSEGGFVSEDDLDLARRDLDVAEAARRAAAQRERLTFVGPLPEELARARAEAEAAEHREAEMAARVAKCVVHAPIAGTVLRRHLEPGEQVSLALPRPIVSLADTSSLRVRAEVDERDIGRVREGLAVEVLVDAYPAERFAGRVMGLEPTMGRKHIRTGDPAEKSDRDVREVLIDLDRADPRLPVGLRVTVRFAAIHPTRGR